MNKQYSGWFALHSHFSLFIGLIAVFLSGLFVFITVKDRIYQNKILPNVYIDSVQVSGRTKEDAIAILKTVNIPKYRFFVDFSLNGAPIATMSARDISYELSIQDGVEHAYLMGRSENAISRLYQKLALYFGLSQENFPLTATFDKDGVKKQLKDLNEAYEVSPIDARFEFSGDKVAAFSEHKDGVELTIDEGYAKLEEEVNKIKKYPRQHIAITLERRTVPAKIRLDTINGLGIREIIAEGKSSYVGSSYERASNIATGSQKINGIIIKPGETFSFVNAVGDISSATGFKQAYIISNGRTVLGDGGGICQVSTTLFRAALNAGLPIVERHAHAYRVGYYEQDSAPGFDATIYSPTVDLKFKNNYKNALLIQTYVDEANYKLTYRIYGTRDSRQIELSDAMVWNVSSAPPAEYIDDPTLPLGVTKQVDFAAGGASAKFHYKVVKDKEILFEENFVSHFRPWKAIFMVGKKS